MKTTPETTRFNRIEKIGKMTEVTFRVAKAEWEETIALDKIPLETLAELVRYGAQRWWNDKTAGMEPDEAKAKIAELWKIAIESETGWQGRAPAVGKAPVNPIEAEMHRMAQDAIKGALKAKGIALKAVKDKMPELIAGYVAKNGEALRKQAEAVVKARAEADDILGKLDLDL